jgi:hypothetical protein
MTRSARERAVATQRWEMNLDMDIDDLKEAVREAHPSIDDMARDLLIEKLNRIHTWAYRYRAALTAQRKKRKGRG